MCQLALVFCQSTQFASILAATGNINVRFETPLHADCEVPQVVMVPQKLKSREDLGHARSSSCQADLRMTHQQSDIWYSDAGVRHQEGGKQLQDPPLLSAICWILASMTCRFLCRDLSTMSGSFIGKRPGGETGDGELWTSPVTVPLWAAVHRAALLRLFAPG